LSFRVTMKKKLHHASLQIDIEQAYSDASAKMDCSWQWGETTYRRDGFSIGRDYLRLEGKTVTRGSINAEHLMPCLDTVLGTGAFSTVYLAHLRRSSENENEEKVAVKQCHLFETSKDRRDMLLQELRTLCLADSPALIKLHGAFLEKDTVTTVLEYMDCGSLDALLGTINCNRQHSSKSALSPTHRLPETVAASVTYQALFGLSYLHENKILHRDIKPSNLLLNHNGCLKWCDFGISAMDEVSCHRTAVGTTVYMAPERLRGKTYGRSSDIWSAGLVFLEAITGQLPPWSLVQSMVEMLVTIEDIDFTQDIIPNGCRRRSELAMELLVGCLQHDPSKRIPAKVLCCSPWFKQVGVDGLVEAQQVLQHFLTLPSFKNSIMGSTSPERRQPLRHVTKQVGRKNPFA